MTEYAIFLMLWSLAIFQTKHALCDFVLSPRYALRQDDDEYFRRRRLIYAGLHAIGSLPAVLMIYGSPAAMFWAFVAELVLVYNLAWLRGRLIARIETKESAAAQAVFGAEQFLHQLYYLLLILVALVLATS